MVLNLVIGYFVKISFLRNKIYLLTANENMGMFLQITPRGKPLEVRFKNKKYHHQKVE